MEKDVREHTEEKAGCQGAGEGTEDWKEKEKQQYLGGLRRLSEKGIAIYVDGRVSGPPEWEKLFEIRTIICFIWEIMYRQNPEG
ncbi:MAG: hypothetical protein ACLVIR_10525 [Clostridium sp.]